MEQSFASSTDSASKTLLVDKIVENVNYQFVVRENTHVWLLKEDLEFHTIDGKENEYHFDHNLDAISNYCIKTAYSEANKSELTNELIKYCILPPNTLIQRANNVVYYYPHKDASIKSEFFWFVRVYENRMGYISANPSNFYIQFSKYFVLRLLYNIFNLFTTYSMFISLIFDILLIYKVYYPKKQHNTNSTYFNISICFIAIPLCLTSFILLCHYWNGDNNSKQDNSSGGGSGGGSTGVNNTHLNASHSNVESSFHSQNFARLSRTSTSHLMNNVHNKNKNKINQCGIIDKIFLNFPIINIFYFLLFYHIREGSTSKFASIITLLLVYFMVYPLMILNVAYLIENLTSIVMDDNNDDVSIYNILELFMSIYVICISSLSNYLQWINDGYLKYGGLILSWRDKIKTIATVSLIIIPMIILDIVQFFPILFTYYNHNEKYLTKEWQLGILLAMFNAPKCFFIGHLWFSSVASCGDGGSDGGGSDTASNNYNGHWIGQIVHCCSMSVVFLCLVSVFCTLPLVPYVMILLNHIDTQDLFEYLKVQNSNKKRKKHKQNVRKYSLKTGDEWNLCAACCKEWKTMFFDGYCNDLACFYWILICYLWIAFIGSNGLLIYFTKFWGHQWNNNFVFYVVCVVACLVVWLTLAVPRVYYAIIVKLPFGLRPID